MEASSPPSPAGWFGIFWFGILWSTISHIQARVPNAAYDDRSHVHDHVPIIQVCNADPLPNANPGSAPVKVIPVSIKQTIRVFQRPSGYPEPNGERRIFRKGDPECDESGVRSGHSQKPRHTGRTTFRRPNGIRYC